MLTREQKQYEQDQNTKREIYPNSGIKVINLWYKCLLFEDL